MKKISAVLLTAMLAAPLSSFASDSAGNSFEALDKDADGQISLVEASEVPELAEQFEEVDTDKNGFLSQEEFSVLQS